LAGAGTVSLVLIGLLRRFQVPAFQQDWLWPATWRQVYIFTSSNLFAWRQGGAGGPAIYPVPWIPNLLAGIVSQVFGAYFGLLLFLAIVLVAGAFGIARLARRFTDSALLISCSIIIFLGSPIVLNELKAGHLYYLISYACLPFVVDLAMKRCSFRNALILGCVMGIGAAQQQFLVFNLLLFVGCWLFFNRMPFQYILVTTVAFLLVSSPEWILALVQGTHSLNAYIPLLHWERAESMPLGSAIRGIGYMAGYDRILPPIAQWGLGALPILTIFSLFFGRRRASLFFAALSGVGIVMASGLDGPISPLIAFLFAHVRYFALFRELYDFFGLAAFGYALVPVLLLSSSRPRPAGSLWVAVPLVLVAVLAAGATAAQSSTGIARVPGSLNARIRSFEPRGYRFLSIPSSFPQVSNSGQKGGFSPLLIGLPGHPSASSPFASFPEAYAASIVSAKAHSATAVLARFGISDLLPTPDVFGDERRVIEPALRSLIPPIAKPRIERITYIPGGDRVVVLPFSAKPGTLASHYAGARDLRPFRSYSTIDPNLLSIQPDPRLGWARTFYWGSLPRWVYAVQSGVFTTRPRLAATIPPATLVVGSQNGKVSAEGCRALMQLDFHWRILRCGRNPVLTGQPPIAISTIALRTSAIRKIPVQGTVGPATIIFSNPSYIRVVLTASKGSVVVLRESFNTGWQISIPETSHVEVDGYANGWVLSHKYSGQATIYYAPQTLYSIALICSLAATLLALGVSLTKDKSGAINETRVQ